MKFIKFLFLLFIIASCSKEVADPVKVKFAQNLKGKSFEYVYRSTKRAFHFPTESNFFMIYAREFDNPLYRGETNEGCSSLTNYEIRNTLDREVTFEYRLCGDTENRTFTIKALDTINLCATYVSGGNSLFVASNGRCENIPQRDCTKFSFDDKETYYNENILDLGLVDPERSYLESNSRFEILKDTETELFYRIEGMASIVRIELTYDESTGTISENTVLRDDGTNYANTINPRIFNFAFDPDYLEACD